MNLIPRKVLIAIGSLCLATTSIAQTAFTAGNLVVLQTSGTTSKASSPVTLKEYSTSGTLGMSVAIPATGSSTFQTSGAFGGSEGFLTTATNGKYLVMAGYGTAGTFTDITATASASVPRVIGTVAPSGFYLQVDTSTIFYSANDIRGAISDGTNYWASGASNAGVDGIDYFGPSTPAALAGGTTPAKPYAIRIFNGQIYYSTQKSGPSNTSSQLGIFSLGSGLPTSGTISPTQIINTGSIVPQDFSFNANGDVCYIAISLNTAAGGIQKWTKSGSTWALAYTLGTGITNTGAYGLVADYSGTVPVIYATTFDAAGNRIIRIVDNGTLASASISTIVAATTGTYFKGISFAPVASGTPVVNLTISTDTASESGQTVVIVKANSSFPVTSSQTVNLAISGTGITNGDYTLSSTSITIPTGATFGTDTFTIVNDILVEGTEHALLQLRTPSSGITIGIDSVKSVTIADDDAPAPPTIFINLDSTSNFLDGGTNIPQLSPFKISSVIGDPTDPAANLGIAFDVATTQGAGLITVTTFSSDTVVVPSANILVSGSGGLRYVKIAPAAVGYANITVKVNDGNDSAFFTIAIAASANSNSPATTVWHTGMSDGSDAIALDDDFYVCGDDELNVLNVYSRKHSGLPLVSYNYTSNLALPDPAKPEADIEAATRSVVNPTRVYWTGSMSNGKSPFDNKPNRDRIFATNISGTGAATAFTFGGYAALKSSILSWGDANGYDFTASAAAGVDSKLPSGFATEGMVFGPDSTTLYIAFRTPLVPMGTRTKAVIAPIKNFETWFNNGNQTGSPTFGAPIEMDLGGRGFRDITKLSNGTYVIIAGNPGGAPLRGAIYKWSGKASDAPILLNCPAGDTLNMEGVMQVNTPGQAALTQLQVITDMGDDVYYNDGTAAKDFGDLQLRKFRSDILNLTDLTLPLSITTLSANTQPIAVYPNASSGPVTIQFNTQLQENYTLIITDMLGKTVFSRHANSRSGINLVKADLGALPKGSYLVQLRSTTIHANQQLLLK